MNASLHTLASMKETFLDPLIKIGNDMVGSIYDTVPQLILALVILLVGYFIASILKKFITKFLKGIKFDELLDRIGVGPIFTKIGLKGSSVDVIAKVIFWIVLLFVFKNAADTLGVKDISNIITSVMEFLPKVMIASIIMLVGFMIADLVQNAVFAMLDKLGLDYAKALSAIIFGFIFVLVLTVALSQLGIETELLNASVKIILAALGLGLAICLGLGLKGMANQIVSGVYARDIYKVGTIVEYDGEESTVAGVGPITTKLIRKDGGFIMVPNHLLVSEKVRGRAAE